MSTLPLTKSRGLGSCLFKNSPSGFIQCHYKELGITKTWFRLGLVRADGLYKSRSFVQV